MHDKGGKKDKKCQNLRDVIHEWFRNLLYLIFRHCHGAQPTAVLKASHFDRICWSNLCLTFWSNTFTEFETQYFKKKLFLNYDMEIAITLLRVGAHFFEISIVLCLLFILEFSLLTFNTLGLNSVLFHFIVFLLCLCFNFLMGFQFKDAFEVLVCCFKSFHSLCTCI